MNKNDDDTKQNTNNLYIDPKSKIHGKCGNAITVYWNNVILAEMSAPKSSRTHINIMELDIMYMAFKWIANFFVSKFYDCIPRIAGIHIISDSQNCINIVSQQTSTKDDVMINIHKLIDDEIKILTNLQLPSECIKMQWVHSHDNQSKMHEQVDLNAKNAAQSVFDQFDDEINWMYPNEYVCYNTVKSEVKYKAFKYDSDRWNEFKMVNNRTYLRHYWDWRIPWAPKRYSEMISFLTPFENDIRILLLTMQLPFNYYMVHKAMNTNYDDLCCYPNCNESEQIEDLYHALLICPDPKLIKHRNRMIEEVRTEYDIHKEQTLRLPSCKQPKKIVEFFEKPILQQGDDDDYDPDPKRLYLKQFIFPDFQMDIKRRMCIFKAIKFYIINARPDIIDKIKNKECMKFNSDASQQI